MKGSTTGWKSGEGSGDRIGSSRISLAQEEETGVEVGQEEDCFEMKSRNFSSRSSFVSTVTFVFMSCVGEIVPVVEDEVTVFVMDELAGYKGLDNC